MKLDELLHGEDYDVTAWLRSKKLVHTCTCGYDVYDPEEVSAAVQRRWGDRRCDEIHSWACDLSNRFGWLFIETSNAKHDIYHCQYCAGSDWGLLMDMMAIAGPEGSKRRRAAAKAPAGKRARREKYLVYVDESYTNEFPRLPGGSLALAALVLSASDAKKLEPGLKGIFAAAYRGGEPGELKYSRVSKRPGLLARVSAEVGALISSLPSAAVIALYVPSEGLIREKVRVARAVAHYAGRAPTADELTEPTTKESVERAVRDSVHGMAQSLSIAVANFLGMKNARAEICFDPRRDEADRRLSAELADLLPKIPIDIPLIPHDGVIVMPRPSPSMKRLGRRVRINTSLPSDQSPGLQLADFLAGDIRAFFSDVPELLTEATSDELILNERVLFLQAFRPTELSGATKEKIAKYSGKSALPLYRSKLVHGLISCYALNGQVRNVSLDEGMVYDIPD